ncbi:RING-H2 finger protein [bacterium]|jgi:hypothetical protein|nr:RING-H2 finger protein [bacterium]
MTECLPTSQEFKTPESEEESQSLAMTSSVIATAAAVTALSEKACPGCRENEVEVTSTPAVAQLLPPMAPTAAPIVIQDVDHLLSGLQRLKKNNDALIFHNHDNTFKILLRNDPDAEDETFSGDLCIYYPDETSQDEAVKRVVKLDTEGYEEDDVTYVLESFELQLSDREAAADMATYINRVYAMQICRCRRYFIRDVHDFAASARKGMEMCVFCTMTGTPTGMAPQFCVVCHEISPKMHMTTQLCCGQTFHTSCLDAWYESSGKMSCPHCRSS